MLYPALLPLMPTPRLPVVHWTDAHADLNGLVHFAERPNLVSVPVPSHFKRSLQSKEGFSEPTKSSWISTLFTHTDTRSDMPKKENKFYCIRLHFLSACYSVLLIISATHVFQWGRDSSVGIVTRYGLDGPGIDSRWGRDFSHPSRTDRGHTQHPVQWVQGLSRG